MMVLLKHIKQIKQKFRFGESYLQYKQIKQSKQFAEMVENQWEFVF